MSQAATRMWSPWSGAGGRRAVAVAAVGHGLWLLGWWMAAREAAFAEQIPAVNVAIVGMILVAYADGSWLVRSHRRIVRRRRAVLAGLGRAEAVAADGTMVVSGPGRGFYHRPGCGFTAGRDWPVLPAAVVTGRDQQPCGVCRP